MHFILIALPMRIVGAFLTPTPLEVSHVLMDGTKGKFKLVESAEKSVISVRNYGFNTILILCC